jgi:hypothetical protein
MGFRLIVMLASLQRSQPRIISVTTSDRTRPATRLPFDAKDGDDDDDGHE